MPKFETRFLESPYLIFEREWLDGERYRFRTESPYVLSVIRNRYSYGGEQGLFELAIVLPNNYVCEPIGYLTVDEVLAILDYENGKDVESEIIREWKKPEDINRVEQRVRFIRNKAKELNEDDSEI
ncbi:hypothetical protein [Staphylococcus americanisciuri]|uniref:Uncharacterized protein n=1 Tax=Staphylococcus americanisciuri TaxID=2973940 RepID=A0ABT2F401_9STAP|nr:hypothetical protein [Staphylococcus americanisciuri]MCS4487210.1 hypothetical protein [Staphylococcus americanisciuri]